MGAFKLTPKQEEANALLASYATHIMLAGGSRSGKTVLFLRAMVIRALKAPGSRHCVLRFRFGHCRQSIGQQTLPWVMRTCFPEVQWDLNGTDWIVRLPGASEIWLGGLDDKDRVEKILGQEYVTLFFNECSQIPYNSRNVAMTRLSQKVDDALNGRELALKAYYDENPPDKGHWSYKLFRLHVDPESRQAIGDPKNYEYLKINPGDNRENLPDEYFKTLEALPPRLRKRFLEGEFRDANPGALFDEATFERWRVIDQELPDLLRIVVAVDPSGADDEDNTDNDEIGIIVAALGVDGNAYILEDLTCKAGPAVWGRVATTAFERHEADRIVAETNYGGAMVRSVIHAARPRTPFREVRASRGKVVRAEPVSALFEAGKVRFVGFFRELEDELTAFTTHGYMGERSPNRADAAVWAISDLFPELTKPKEEPQQVVQQVFMHRRTGTEWMRR